ncbi:MAG: cupin domain-containing protein [Chloroflexi bacterium]|nr:cupin domain-containing protein [Chloroflexota bacterium]
MPDDITRSGMSQSSRDVPRVLAVSELQPRANSATSRSARAVTDETVGATRLLSGMFWSDEGSEGGWSFGDTDPGIAGAPYVGVGEEVYLCLKGRVHVEWEGGEFEFGAGDIVYWPNNRWYRTRVLEPVQMFYVMAPPPTSMWGLFERVDTTGAPVAE